MKEVVDVSRSQENVKALASGLLHLEGQSSWARGGAHACTTHLRW